MFNSVTLEMSLKPFKETNDEYIRNVCAKFYKQWYLLLKNRKTISILLWTADGSEILDYSGVLDEAFEWCYYIGTANKPLSGKNDNPAKSLHYKKRYYMQNPPVMTYRILKRIVELIKEEGKKIYPDSVIRVGETFDIGPEFAVSDFKYNRHTEVITGAGMDALGFLDPTTSLNGDNRRYAAYPNGIPDKTPFGTFFGKQSNAFLKDMGFDYIWFSNGIGFSVDPWDTIGKIFDGERFHTERLTKTKSEILHFWHLFRTACPDVSIETRGTNYSVGIDYASDGVPLYEIYNAGFNITPPPNSPWAALNGDFALEIMGHMTRICELPGDEFMFRYYVHDPWWINSPWYDRYNGCPHDIYLPMAISRIDSNGNTKSAELFNILSIDNSFGNMPDTCVREPLPHILKAEKDAPDDVAPFVWVYPMREYTTTDSEELLHEMYYGDKFICEAINVGFPLNCIVSSDNFLGTPLSIYTGSVLVTPSQPNSAVAQKLKVFEENGGRVIYYSTKNGLQRLGCDYSKKIDIFDSPESMRLAAAELGYEIDFDCKKQDIKVPIITVHKNNNAMIFSVYNSNTTTDTYLKFPLGAPVFDCTETELVNGYAKYHFSRFEHKECRVFVKQDTGIVSVKEQIPGSVYHRRRILISGLQEATICVFPEKNQTRKCDFVDFSNAMDSNGDPIVVSGWELIEDEHGIYYRAEHVSGEYLFCMPYEELKC